MEEIFKQERKTRPKQKNSLSPGQKVKMESEEIKIGKKLTIFHS